MFNQSSCTPPSTLAKSVSSPLQAEYQILETIPCSIINSTVPDTSMTLPDVVNVAADSGCPYQTHAWLAEKFTNAKYSISMCCMYFTFNAMNCPYCDCSGADCTPSNCNLKEDIRQVVQNLAKDSSFNPDGRIFCGNCINSERGSGCCRSTLPGEIKPVNPTTGVPNDGVCNRDNIREDALHHPDGLVVWNALVAAVKRGVRLNIIFAWPCMVDSAASLKSMLFLKELNPSGVQLYPFNVTSFFRNDPTQLYVDVGGVSTPVFGLTEGTIPYGGFWGCPPSGNTVTEYDSSTFAGDIDTVFAPTGFPATGSGILHSKIYTVDPESAEDCAGYTGAQNASYGGSLELGIGISRSPELVSDLQRILDMYKLAACVQNRPVAPGVGAMQPQAAGTVAEMLDEWEDKYKSYEKPLSLGANAETPYSITFHPTARPNGLDGRLSYNTKGVSDKCSTKTLQKTSGDAQTGVDIANKCKQTRFAPVADAPPTCPGFTAQAYLTNCPKVYCDLTKATYDAQGIINMMDSAKEFLCVNVMDWVEITTYLTCTDAYCSNPEMQVHGTADMQSPWPEGQVTCTDGKYKDYIKTAGLQNVSPATQTWNKSIVNVRGPQAHFTLFAQALMRAAMRGVTVKVLVGQRGKQPCGDDPEKFLQLARRTAAVNAKIKANGGKGSMEARYFVYLCNAMKFPRQCYGAFHQKFVVTDEGVVVSSSNYVADYFATTHGVSFIQKTKSMAYNPLRDDLLMIFKRNFNAGKAVESVVCQCASQGWPQTGLPLPGASPHYFCQTPDCGLSLLNAKDSGGKCPAGCPDSAQTWPRTATGDLDMDKAKCGDYVYDDQISIKDLPSLPIVSKPPTPPPTPTPSSKTTSSSKVWAPILFSVLIIVAVSVTTAIILKPALVSRFAPNGVPLSITLSTGIGAILLFFVGALAALGRLEISYTIGTIALVIVAAAMFANPTLRLFSFVPALGALFCFITGLKSPILGSSSSSGSGPTPPSPPPVPTPPAPAKLLQPGIYRPIDPYVQLTTGGKSQVAPTLFFSPSGKAPDLSRGIYNLSDGTFQSALLKVPTLKTWQKDCLTNYFKLLYPAVSPQWFNDLPTELLAYLYSCMDWLYTPLVIHPQLPARSRQELTDYKNYKTNDRQRPVLAPYYDSYVPNFSMGCAEVATSNNFGNPDAPTGTPAAMNQGATGLLSYPWPSRVQSGMANPLLDSNCPSTKQATCWPEMPTHKDGSVPSGSMFDPGANARVGKPGMEVHFLAPWGRPRHGYPSYSYVESVSGGQELGGAKQRTAPSCSGANSTEYSTFGDTLTTVIDANYQAYNTFVNAPPVQGDFAANSPAYQGISGYYSKMQGGGVGQPQKDTKEEFTVEAPDFLRRLRHNESDEPEVLTAPAPVQTGDCASLSTFGCGGGNCPTVVNQFRSDNTDWCAQGFYSPKLDETTGLPVAPLNPNPSGTTPIASGGGRANYGWGSKEGTCLFGHGGFIGNPWLLYNSYDTTKKASSNMGAVGDDWLLPASVPGSSSFGYLKDPMVVLSHATGYPLQASELIQSQGANATAYLVDPDQGKVSRASVVGYFPDSPDAFCPTSDASDSCRVPQELFYPVKGYGKFINLGRVGVFFNNWAVLLTINDRNGEGKQFRWCMEQFMAISIGQNSSPGSADCPHGGGICGSIQALAGNESDCRNVDNREYLSGFFTFPKNGTFGINMEPVKRTKVYNWQLQSCKSPNVQGTDKKCYKPCKKKVDPCSVDPNKRAACDHCSIDKSKRVDCLGTPGKPYHGKNITADCAKNKCCYEESTTSPWCYKGFDTSDQTQCTQAGCCFDKDKKTCYHQNSNIPPCGCVESCQEVIDWANVGGQYESSGGRIEDYPTTDSFSVDSRGIPMKCSDPGGIVGAFIPEEPQVIWSGKDNEGAGQSYWQRGMDYTMPDNSVQRLHCENPWMNPMDDGEMGRLTYIGKNFVQYYIPPELGLKNPYYKSKISDFYPGGIHSSIKPDDQAGIAAAYDQMRQDLGMPKGVTQEMIRHEFALRWTEGSIIYGDNGIHTEGKTWPFGMQSNASTADGSCVYKVISAMGWNSVVVTMKPCRLGQPDVCETPYYDSEIIYLPCHSNFSTNLCKNNGIYANSSHCVNGMSTWAGPLGVDVNFAKSTSCPLSSIIGKKSIKQVTMCVPGQDAIYQDEVGVCSAPYAPGGTGYYQDSWKETDVCVSKPKDLQTHGYSGKWAREWSEGNNFQLYLNSSNPKQSAHTAVCRYMRVLDISKCLDLYLKWGFVPAFNDRSTPSAHWDDDCQNANKNKIYWNATVLNRNSFTLSEVSFDKPAQIARRYFAPPKANRTQYCSQCPGVAIAEVTPPQFKGQNYIQATEPYRGIPFINHGVGEGYGNGWPPQPNASDMPTDKSAMVAQADGDVCGSDGKQPCAPVFRSHPVANPNQDQNIFTQWGKRGAFGSFDFTVPSKGNEIMKLTKFGTPRSTNNPDYLACHEVQGLVDLHT
jgi:phosphatidylserine/phosphatidylglycerophosphate/cardiolipin synthase-like enzyme